METAKLRKSETAAPFKAVKLAYRGEVYAAIHETIEALHEVGAIDQQTMGEFDSRCLDSEADFQKRV